MSYNAKNFSVMAYANGFTLWSYSTADNLETVKATGYFDETAPFVRQGDMILANTAVESTLAPAILSVASVAANAVIVSAIAPAASAA